MRRRRRERPPDRALRGTPGAPADWRPTERGAGIALHRPGFADADASYIYTDTDYADATAPAGAPARPAERGTPGPVAGPLLHPPVWTWEVPAYFWLGGTAAGAAFAALACDLAGDRHAAVIARRTSLAAAVPCAPLLISDLGRPERFLHMLRVLRPRSPMSLGAWNLAAFSTLLGGAVAADLAGRPVAARRLGGAGAFLGTHLGTYTGALLASTAVPLWSRSRLWLGPLFGATATAAGAAATGLALAATGASARSGPRRALAHVESAALLAEVAGGAVLDRRLGPLAAPLTAGPGRRPQRAGRAAALGSVALRIAGGRRRVPGAASAASVLALGTALAVRIAWVRAGRASAADDATVAATARGRSRPGSGRRPD